MATATAKKTPKVTITTTPKRAPKAKSPKAITIPKIDIRVVKNVTLVGDSPLVTHNWSHKAKTMMLDKQMKKAKQAKEAKDPWADFVDSLYWISAKPAKPTPADVDKGVFGLPAIALKSAAVDACSHVDGVTKVQARGSFHINCELVEIISGPPEQNESMVRIAMGTSDIRYRGMFREWSVKFDLRYNAASLSLEQIYNLFNTAGFGIGVGEHRPQKNGSWGMFHVG